MSQRLTLINLSAMSRRGLGKRCSFYFTRVVNSLQFEQLVAENCGGVAVLHHRLGDIGEPLMRSAGMGPQQGEGLLHIHITAFSQHTFGLLDHHPGVEGDLELLVDHVGSGQDALVQNPNCCDVCESLTNGDVGRNQGARLIAEEIQRTNALIPKPQRQRAYRSIVVFFCALGEFGPALRIDPEIVNGDLLPAPVGKQTRSEVRLDLKQFEQSSVLTA